MRRLEPRAIRCLFLALTLIAVAAACSPAANALPTAPPAAGASAAGPQASGSEGGAGSPVPSGAITDPAVAWPAFAACLRAHGAEIADPEVDANGDPIWNSGDDLKKVLTEPMRTDCGPIIAAVTEAGPSNQRARRSYSFDSLVAHAGCMREHALTEWPDPNPNELDAGMPAGYDKADPNVLAALIACEPLLVETTASPSPSL